MVKKEKKVLEKYEEPEIEFIEFMLEDSIATSGDFGSSTICSEGRY